MAISLSNFVVCLSVLLTGSHVGCALAATVTLDWNVTWVYANPDNLAVRPVMGINGQWPLPQLNVTKGDQVIVNLNNQLGNASTSLHFHGLFQNGTNEMDGPVGVTQCDIPPGHTFVYNFTIDQPGTYWYHSHSRAQYPDGLRGQLVVTDPENPFFGQYDKEVAFTLSDWYHDLTPNLMSSFISYTNPTGAEPVPNSALMNDTQNFTVSVEPGQTYFFRLTNIGAFAGQYFWIEGHNMTIIEVDGVYTKPQEASMIYLTAAQRYGFLVTARNDSSANFAMMGSMDTDLFDSIPDGLNWNVTGWLTYDASAPMLPAAELDEFDPFDDFTLEAYDGEDIFDHVDYSFSLDLTMQDLGDGANYAFFNDITYVTPKVPTLYSAITTGANASDPAVYGGYTNAFVLQKNEIVEIVLNNDDTGKHPFHLHGHNFQAVVRGDDNSGHYDPTNQTYFPQVPMRRDTFMVRPLGHFVIRFRADNPGIWLFHCHIEWHIASGLVATMIESPLDIQEKIPSIPQNHIDTCIAGGNQYQGNAAGNTENFLDLDGQNASPAPLPAGFTPRGIVALVFSCLSAFLGLAVIGWYGAAPLSETEMAQTRRFVAEAGSDESK